MHCLSITDFTASELFSLIRWGSVIRKEWREYTSHQPFLQNKTLAMIFEKPSLRTRVSFEVGMTQLGGHAVYLSPADIGLGTREPVRDVGIVLSRMADIMLARVFSHETVVGLAESSTVPVINGLSDYEHPCQVLADMQTLYDHFGYLEGLTVSYVGDCANNVTRSLAFACALLGMGFRCAGPEQYQMEDLSVQKVMSLGASVSFTQTTDVREAISNADVVVTDTWVSMGSEEEKEKRVETLRPYQVTEELFNCAKNTAVFLHCLPAYRGNEVVSEVIESTRSLVWDEAENRLHAQKALLLYLLGSEPSPRS